MAEQVRFPTTAEDEDLLTAELVKLLKQNVLDPATTAKYEKLAEALESSEFFDIRDLFKDAEIPRPRNLLEKHWKDVFPEEKTRPILHYACETGLANVAEVLLNFQSSVDSRMKDDKTLLHEAAQFSRSNICEVLLERGANVDALKRSDWTPLMLACTKAEGDASLKTVEVLLKYKPEVNCKNKDGWTALHLVSRSGDVRIFRELLRHGLDVHLKTNNGRTALHVAALHGNEQIAAELLNLGLEVDEQDECGNTALHEAILGNSVGMCKFLIDQHKANSTVKNLRGYGILHLAASWEHLELIDYMVSELKWNINERSEDGFTPLHCAAKNGHRKAFELLESRGADLDAEDKFNRIPISYFP